MKILIIGAKGFIGSHCVSYFSEDHEVWQCDIVVDYTTPNYILLEETNSDYREIFETHLFDVCINCSGAASVPDSIEHPQNDFNLNVVSVFKQLDALRLHCLKCLYIHISSAAVYGNPKTLPISENDALTPISPYGKHKKMAEDICEEFYTQFGVRSCSLRVFSAYGPGLKKQLFWDLYKKQLLGNNIELYGTGKESRDFIYVTDLVEAIHCIIQKAEFMGQAINVANGKELTIKEVASLFCKQQNASIGMTFLGKHRHGDPKNWVANIELLKQMGYVQNVSIQDGLSNYILWRKELG
jgi:dTDP-glucose 4,6-dehydratase/UDP-glucose 4-epimerase